MKIYFEDLIPSLYHLVRPFVETAIGAVNIRFGYRVEIDPETGVVTLGWDYPLYSSTPKHSMVLPINLGPLVELPVPFWVKAEETPTGSWCREADIERHLGNYLDWARTVMAERDSGREMSEQ